jgi:signal transduction histidine kinase
VLDEINLKESIMNYATGMRLQEKIPTILNIWEERAKKEILAAHDLEILALRDSIPEYIMGLVNTLNRNFDRNKEKKDFERGEGYRLGKLHGDRRAKDLNYTIDQLIFEYHILRQVIFDELEKEENLGRIEREIILCSIEQAVNDAATHFSIYKEETIKLSEAIRARDEFLSIASHELRSPITSLKLQLEMILRNIVQNKSGAKDLNVLRKAFDNSIMQVNRLTKLVEDLLDISSVHLGKLKINLERSIDIGSLVQEVIQRFQEDDSVLVLSKININFSPPDSPIVGNIDSSRIRQVLRNLVSNSIKYGGNLINIKLKKISSTEVEMTVEDNGRGIDSKDQERIFHQFERAGSNMNKSGLGLGLYISNQIIIAHGGSIKVESKIGIGTKFIFTFKI